MGEYFGIIDNLFVTNSTGSGAKKDGLLPSFLEMKAGNVKYVHYSDCQQLIIWLPQYGRSYEMYRLWNKTARILVEEGQVCNRLNGSIQIIWDTLPFAPALYVLEIDWKNGCKHEISFIKREEAYLKAEAKTDGPSLIQQPLQKEPVIYKDGYGNPIVNQDLELADKVRKDIVRKFSRRIDYEGNFRAGTIIYIDSEIQIRFNHEMGGGNCMFYVEIPTEQEWENKTNTSLKDRQSILQFVAETLKREQASASKYVIEHNQITFYRS